jgi:hypothetical protein
MWNALNKEEAPPLLKNADRAIVRGYLEDCEKAAQHLSDKFMVWCALFLLEELEKTEESLRTALAGPQRAPYR